MATAGGTEEEEEQQLFWDETSQRYFKYNEEKDEYYSDEETRAADEAAAQEAAEAAVSPAARSSSTVSVSSRRSSIRPTSPTMQHGAPGERAAATPQTSSSVRDTPLAATTSAPPASAGAAAPQASSPSSSTVAAEESERELQATGDAVSGPAGGDVFPAEKKSATAISLSGSGSTSSRTTDRQQQGTPPRVSTAAETRGKTESSAAATLGSAFEDEEKKKKKKKEEQLGSDTAAAATVTATAKTVAPDRKSPEETPSLVDTSVGISYRHIDSSRSDRSSKTTSKTPQETTGKTDLLLPRYSHSRLESKDIRGVGGNISNIVKALEHAATGSAVASDAVLHAELEARRKENQELHQKVTTLQRRIEELTVRLLQADQGMTDDERVASMTRERDDLTLQVRRLEEDIISLEEGLEAAAVEKETAVANIERQRELTNDLQLQFENQLVDKELEIATLREQLVQQQIALQERQQQQQEIQQLKERVLQYDKTFVQLKQLLLDVSVQKQNAEAEVASLRTYKQHAEAIIKHLETAGAEDAELLLSFDQQQQLHAEVLAGQERQLQQLVQQLRDSDTARLTYQQAFDRLTRILKEKELFHKTNAERLEQENKRLHAKVQELQLLTAPRWQRVFALRQQQEQEQEQEQQQQQQQEIFDEDGASPVVLSGDGHGYPVSLHQAAAASGSAVAAVESSVHHPVAVGKLQRDRGEEEEMRSSKKEEKDEKDGKVEKEEEREGKFEKQHVMPQEEGSAGEDFEKIWRDVERLTLDVATLKLQREQQQVLLSCGEERVRLLQLALPPSCRLIERRSTPGLFILHAAALNCFLFLSHVHTMYVHPLALHAAANPRTIMKEQGFIRWLVSSVDAVATLGRTLALFIFYLRSSSNSNSSSNSATSNSSNSSTSNSSNSSTNNSSNSSTSKNSTSKEEESTTVPSSLSVSGGTEASTEVERARTTAVKKGEERSAGGTLMMTGATKEELDTAGEEIWLKQLEAPRGAAYKAVVAAHRFTQRLLTAAVACTLSSSLPLAAAEEATMAVASLLPSSLVVAALSPLKSSNTSNPSPAAAAGDRKPPASGGVGSHRTAAATNSTAADPARSSPTAAARNHERGGRNGSTATQEEQGRSPSLPSPILSKADISPFSLLPCIVATLHVSRAAALLALAAACIQNTQEDISSSSSSSSSSAFGDGQTKSIYDGSAAGSRAAVSSGRHSTPPSAAAVVGKASTPAAPAAIQQWQRVISTCTRALDILPPPHLLPPAAGGTALLFVEEDTPSDTTTTVGSQQQPQQGKKGQQQQRQQRELPSRSHNGSHNHTPAAVVAAASRELGAVETFGDWLVRCMRETNACPANIASDTGETGVSSTQREEQDATATEKNGEEISGAQKKEKRDEHDIAAIPSCQEAFQVSYKYLLLLGPW